MACIVGRDNGFFTTEMLSAVMFARFGFERSVFVVTIGSGASSLSQVAKRSHSEEDLLLEPEPRLTRSSQSLWHAAWVSLNEAPAHFFWEAPNQVPN